MTCENSRTIHTIGHSTRSIEDLIELLRAHRVKLLIDVRRWPASRRLPHFNREALAASLDQKGIDYLWRQDLGGFRKAADGSPNTAWRVATFRAYADFMLTAEFEKIMTELEPIAASGPVAIMCAEAVPWRCHRSLIGDALLVRGFAVEDILGPQSRRPHTLTPFARVEGARVTYPALDV